MSEKERYHIGTYTNPSGVEVFRVSGRTQAGEQIRRNFRSYDEAIAYKAELEIAALNIIQAVRLKQTRLSDQQLAEAETAIQKLESGGHSLGVAVDFFLRNWKPSAVKKTVKEAYDEFLLDKKAQKLRQRSIDDLKNRVNKLVRVHANQFVSEITEGLPIVETVFCLS